MRKTDEETLNALPNEEASGLVGAELYERTAGRVLMFTKNWSSGTAAEILDREWCRQVEWEG